MTRRIRLPDETGIFVVLVLVFAGFALLSAHFLTVSNSKILLLNGSVIAFMALGQTFVLLTGGIDLSTGGNVAMTGVLSAMIVRDSGSWILGAIGGPLIGLALGAVNGAIVHYIKVPPFIVTFATMGVATSVPLIVTGASSIPVTDVGYAVIGQGYVAGIPVPVVMLVIAAIIAWFLLRWTLFGAHVYAFGGNKEAAHLAGVSVSRTTISVYAASGLCAGIGGLISTSRLMVGFPATGTGNELFFSIAAAVVGGVSLFGGIGSVLGAMIGAVLIATISNGLNVLSVSSYWQALVIGVIILFGVTIDTTRRTLREGRLPPALRRRLGRLSRAKVPTTTDDATKLSMSLPSTTGGRP